jgi:hypothetical protein
MMFKDDISLSTTRELTPEGFLKARATLTCVGVQKYLGQELQGLVDGLNPNKTYRVFRPPSAVFSDKTIKSIKLKPITQEHPDLAVDSGNFRRETVGAMGEDVERLNDRQLGASIIIYDERLAEQVKKEGAQVSLGYDAKLKRQSGVYKGQQYDLVFDGPMIVNHLAIVEEGRCGNAAKVLDSVKKGKAMDKKAAKKLMNDADMDGLMNQIAEKIMPAIEKKVQEGDFMDKLAAIVGNSIAQSFENGGSDKLDGSGDMQESDDMDLDDTRDQDMDEDIDEDGSDIDLDDAYDEDMSNEGSDDMDLEDGCDAKDAKDAEDLKDSARTLKTKVNDTINERVEILALAAKLKNRPVKNLKASNKSILIDSLSKYGYKKQELQGESTQSLRGMAKVLVRNRDNSHSYIEKVNDGINQNEALDYADFGSGEINAFTVKNLLKKGGK